MKFVAVILLLLFAFVHSNSFAESISNNLRVVDVNEHEVLLKKYREQTRENLIAAYEMKINQYISGIVSRLQDTKNGHMDDYMKSQVFDYFNSLSEEQQYVFCEILLKHLDNVSSWSTWSKHTMFAGFAIWAIGIIKQDCQTFWAGTAIAWTGLSFWAFFRLATINKYKNINLAIQDLRDQLAKDQEQRLDLITKKQLSK